MADCVHFPHEAPPNPSETSGPERIAYTDDAVKSQISAAVALTPGAFDASSILYSVTVSRTANEWSMAFGETCYIYGLEMIAALAILMTKNNGLENKTVTCNVDNNAAPALLKNNGDRNEIQALTALISHRVRGPGIIPWFERVPSKRNIADLPTRNAKIRYTSIRRGRFTNIRKMQDIAKPAVKNIIAGAPLESPLSNLSE